MFNYFLFNWHGRFPCILPDEVRWWCHKSCGRAGFDQNKQVTFFTSAAVDSFFWDLSQLGVSGFETRVMTRSEGVILKKDSFKMTPLNTYGFQPLGEGPGFCAANCASMKNAEWRVRLVILAKRLESPVSKSYLAKDSNHRVRKSWIATNTNKNVVLLPNFKNSVNCDPHQYKNHPH